MHKSIVHLTVCGVVGLAMTLLADPTNSGEPTGSGSAGVSEGSGSGSSKAQVRVREVLQAHEALIKGIEARSFSFAAAPDPGHFDSTLLGVRSEGDIGAQPASASLSPQTSVGQVGTVGSIDHVQDVRLADGRDPDMEFDDQAAPPVAVPPPLSVWGGLGLMAALALAGIRRRARFA